MRYVDGTDLRGLIDEVGGLAPDRVADIVEQVARALDAAHAGLGWPVTSGNRVAPGRRPAENIETQRLPSDP